MMLTPNGRFELNTKICISFTNYHEESWQPAWGVRTAILGLQGLFPLKGKAALGVGGLESPISDRKRLAVLSRNWECPHCKQTNLECLPDPPASSAETPPGDATAVVLEKPPVTEEPPVTTVSDVVEPAPEETPQPSTAEPPEPEPENNLEQLPPVDSIPTAPSVATFSPVKSTRPPLLLDTAICVLLVLVVALLCRRFL